MFYERFDDFNKATSKAAYLIEKFWIVITSSLDSRNSS